MAEDLDYSNLLIRWTEHKSDADGDVRIRQIAREEADNRIALLIAICASAWAVKEYGWVAAVIIIPAGALFWWNYGIGSASSRYDLVSKAEDIVRLQIVAEGFAAGEAVWEIGVQQGSEKRGIYPMLSERWDDFWKRAYNIALELENQSPRERRRRLVNAAKEARKALAQGREMAARENLELVFWAARY